MKDQEKQSEYGDELTEELNSFTEKMHPKGPFFSGEKLVQLTDHDQVFQEPTFRFLEAKEHRRQ